MQRISECRRCQSLNGLKDHITEKPVGVIFRLAFLRYLRIAPRRSAAHAIYFMHISRNFCTQTRRLLSFSPDQENLRLQGRLRQRVVLYGSPSQKQRKPWIPGKFATASPSRTPEHGSSRVVAEARKISGVRFWAEKASMINFSDPPVQNQRAVHEILQFEGRTPAPAASLRRDHGDHRLLMKLRRFHAVQP